MIEAFEKEPPDFSPAVHVSALYLESEGKILCLQYGPSKKEVGRWGVPAGKWEVGETALEAAQRELLEETGISVQDSSKIRPLGFIYMRRPDMDYLYHLFQVQLDEMPEIQLSEEHQGWRWFSQEDLALFPMMTGAKEGIYHYQKRV
jgi:8-oxo-dGTP diphosphatase